MHEEKHTYGSDPRRAPLVNEGDTIVYDEHGRDYPSLSLTGVTVCHCSHWFRVVSHRHGGFALLVEHGGGREQIELEHEKHAILAMACLSSDDRFHMLSLIHKMHRTAHTAGWQKADRTWRKAVAENRVTRRKMPGRELYKIGIKGEGMSGGVQL